MSPRWAGHDRFERRNFRQWPSSLKHSQAQRSHPRSEYASQSAHASISTRYANSGIEITHAVGKIDVKSNISHKPGKDWQNEYHIRVRDTTIKWENFPYPLTNLSGFIDIYPDHPGPFHLRGKLFASDLGRYEEAIADFDRLISISPHPEGLQLRGYSKLNLGRGAGYRATSGCDAGGGDCENARGRCDAAESQ